MAFTLTCKEAAACIRAVDDKLDAQPCDHTLKNAHQWAQEHGIDWDDLLDLFEEHGCFCDCGVTHFSEVTGVSSKRDELRIHRVFIRGN